MPKSRWKKIYICKSCKKFHPGFIILIIGRLDSKQCRSRWGDSSRNLIKIHPACKFSCFLICTKKKLLTLMLQVVNWVTTGALFDKTCLLKYASYMWQNQPAHMQSSLYTCSMIRHAQLCLPILYILKKLEHLKWLQKLSWKWNTHILQGCNVSKRCRWNSKYCRPWSDCS